MSNALIINASPGETRLALIENGVTVEIHHERSDVMRLTGNIYKGVVNRVLPGMQAAFVDVGLEKAAYLYVDDVGAQPHELPEIDDDSPEEGLRVTEPQASSEAWLRQTRPMPAGGQGEAADERPPIERQLKTGQELLVQVTKGPIGTKGARVTTRLTLPGRLLVLAPHTDHVGVSRRIGDEDERLRLRECIESLRPPGVGFIVRTAAEHATREMLKTDIEVLIAMWNDLAGKKREASARSLLVKSLDLSLQCIRDLLHHDLDRVVVDSDEEYKRLLEFTARVMPGLEHRIELYDGRAPVFDAFSVTDELSRALNRKVWLRCGGYIVIDEHEALSSIDVNTGRFTGRRNLEETILKTNLEAAREVAYQIRLRNIGGIIVIDFIDMKDEEHRERVHRTLEEALQRDRARAKVQPITALGLVEMTRQRSRDSLLKALTVDCGYCDGRGRVSSVATMSFEVVREVARVGRHIKEDSVAIQIHPAVADYLCTEGRALLDEAEQSVGKHTVLLPTPACHIEDFDVIGVDTGFRPESSLRLLPDMVEEDEGTA